MESETVVVAQLVRLLRHSPTVVWELLECHEPARPTDVLLRDTDGKVVAYARPAEMSGKAF